MRKVLKIAAAFLLMTSLAGFCTGGGLDNLESVVSWGKIGDSNDYWVEKPSAVEFGSYDKVALIFGTDDQKACGVIAKAMLAAYEKNWHCVPAN